MSEHQARIADILEKMHSAREKDRTARFPTVINLVMVACTVVSTVAAIGSWSAATSAQQASQSSQRASVEVRHALDLAMQSIQKKPSAVGAVEEKDPRLKANLQDNGPKGQR